MGNKMKTTWDFNENKTMTNDTQNRTNLEKSLDFKANDIFLRK
jgi:hypothetical protein